VSVHASHPHWTSSTIPVRHFAFSSSGRYQLRSTQRFTLELPRTRTRFGERGFFWSCPAASNTLPDLRDITDTSNLHSGNDSRVYFLTMLTTDYCWRCWTCRTVATYKFHVDWLQLMNFIAIIGATAAEMLEGATHGVDIDFLPFPPSFPSHTPVIIAPTLGCVSPTLSASLYFH